ncbi:MAG TPA: HD domain-containing phosphohydrolase [Anaeromyxobacteraceae bacterium]|nr:HD domain-containing phosphohydrolase [Anaeromyxobacteraceae bacterium]
MFDRIVLERDLVDCRGEVLGRRGLVVSRQTVAEAAARAPVLPRRRLEESPLRGDVAAALDEPVHASLFASPSVRASVQRALLAVELPDALLEELSALRRGASRLYEHALATAAVAARMSLAAAGPAKGIPELAAAALLHDLGMRHLPPHLLENRDRLTRAESTAVAAHPLLGAYHLAAVLGDHPAVAAAEGHHWRCGQGYPTLRSPPPRSVEVVAVASSFAALTQPRPFRSGVYGARAAADVLVGEATLGHADVVTVKLLVHALRGGAGPVQQVRFAQERPGQAPSVNRHTRVSAPERSPV